METFFIFDTETTGIPRHPHSKLNVQPHMIEFGGLLVNSENEVLDTINLLIKPPKEFTGVAERKSHLLDWAGIERISGITKEDLEDCPTFEGVLDEIRYFFERADTIVGHNLPFDKTMVELSLRRAGITDWPWPKREICTKDSHSEEWGRWPKLLELFEHYTGTPLDQTHRALDDAKATFIVAAMSGVLL